MYKNKSPQTASKKTSNTNKKTKLIWLSDLHIPDNSTILLPSLLSSLKIASADADAVILTGDVSSSRQLCKNLKAIAAACSGKKLYYVRGNHEAYGSSYAEVDRSIKELSKEINNLHFLTGDRLIHLNSDTCLIGFSGYADSRAGLGLKTFIKSPDHQAIRDFEGLTHSQSLLKMQSLGKESADIIRKILPLALSKYQNVIIATHVPPFFGSNKHCRPQHQPHFVNLCAGLAIWGISKYSQYSKKQISVLAGHDHTPSKRQITPNISMQIAGAKLGTPKLKMLTF